MKYTLKPYQETASQEVLKRLDKSNNARSIGMQAAFSLFAPTGAGKTVIATDVFERLLLPSDDRVPDEKAVIIWFSDNPDLNRQSRHRIEGASSHLASRTVEIDSSFVHEELEQGKIYFLNTQKLSKGSLLTGGRKKRTDDSFELFGAAPDGAQVTIWDTLRNTLNSPDHHVYFVVDEAHRGSGKQNERETILQRLFAGHTPEGASEPVPPMPVVMGISATPGKFKDMVQGMPGDRVVLEDVEVPTDEVQESGLLKDIVELQIPGEEGEAFENVFVTQAAGLLAESTRRWAAYHAEQGGDGKRVVPLMVVQMKDLATPEDMYQVIQSLRQGWPELPYDCFAHVFGEHTPIQAGDTVIPYVEPQSVEDREWIRVLFAKTAISTGWDCPRAEVMVSYRPANDRDYITQVIGRMVRSPLARRIPGDDLLNSVLCLLPRFNRDAAEDVVQRINAPDDIVKPPIIPVVKPELLQPVDSDDLWSLFTQLPREIAPKRSDKPISRLLNVGMELESDGLLDGGQVKAERELVAAVNGLLVRYADAVEKAKQDILKVETSRLVFRYSDRELDSEEDLELVADDRVITDAFERATPVFTQALANLWVDDYLLAGIERGEESENLVIEAHLTLAALAKVDGVREALWREADMTAKKWLDTNRAEIAMLPDSREATYTTLREMAEEPSFVYLTKPKNRLVAPGVWNKEKNEIDPFPRYKKHAFQDKDGTAPAKLNDWEVKVVETEMSRHGFEAWYRNPSRPNPDAVTAVYYDEATGRWRSVQPDFVFFLRDGEGNMRASIVDPHGAYLGDALGKLRGLARYAEQYGDRFVRIESVSGANAESLKVLDLKSEAVRAAVAEAVSAEAVYEKYGYDYR